VLGRHATEPAPDLLVCVVDATNLRLNLRLVLELKRSAAIIVALNMSDLAAQRGYRLDRAALERALGVPVCRPSRYAPAASARSWMPSTLTVSPLNGGRAPHQRLELQPRRAAPTSKPRSASAPRVCTTAAIATRAPRLLSRLDAVVLNPIAGPALLRPAVPHVPGGVQLAKAAAEHHQQRRPGA